MRITIVTGPYDSLPPAGCGAAERVWDGLACRFAASGHGVTFVCRGHPSQVPREVRNGVRYIRRVGFTRCRTVIGNLVKEFVYTLFITPTLPRADVLVSNTFWLPAMAPRVRRLAGKLVAVLNRMPKGQLFLYGKAARVIVLSKVVRDAVLEERPSLSAAVREIPNPIDTDAFCIPGMPRERFGVQTVLYAGRIHPEKGLELLVQSCLQACAQFPNFRLRIVGPWRTEQGGGGAAFREHLIRLGKGLLLEFVEPIRDASLLAQEYQTAHIFTYPSLAEKGETFGVAPLEAMGTGLPVVVSDLACFRDFLEAGRTGLVFDHRAPVAAKNLAAALLQLLTSSDLAEKLGCAAAERAKGFSYPKIARQYLDEFERLIGSTPPRHEA